MAPAVGGHEDKHQRCAHNPRDEVRQVADGLNRFFQRLEVHFVQQHCEENRQREANEHLKGADDQRVAAWPVRSTYRRTWSGSVKPTHWLKPWEITELETWKP